jgi:hypothetical protein
MKKFIFFGLTLISTTFLSAQEVVSYYGKQVKVYGPISYADKINGVFMEYHHELVDGMVYTTLIQRDDKDSEIKYISVITVPVKNIANKEFEIDFTDKYGGDLFVSGLDADKSNRVKSIDYEQSEVTVFKSSYMGLYFSKKQALVDFLAAIKKQRGF